ncbi:stalk domain-containing protein [Paenibacillus sp. FSL R10-2734]|uniref:RCC1 domain-containing protein n=1 Tax=Paenibacillus sp. FSL R10-2734 TaxID=2954691 RepID=UPI0030D95D20
MGREISGFNVQVRRICCAVVGIAIILATVSPLIVKADSAVNFPDEKKLLSGITGLDAGDRSAYAITADGTAWAWGGGYGSIGNGATTPAYTPVKMHIDHVKQVSGGYRHNLILKEDGTVWAVGGNEHGQLGTGTQSLTVLVEPVQVKGLTEVISVSAGGTHSLALRKDGTVWAWGGNEQGELGDNSGKNGLTPVQVKGLPSILSIAAGSNNSVALGNGGEVWVWGSSKSIGIKKDMVLKPTLIEGSGEYRAVDIDGQYGVALRWDGTVWLWSNYTDMNQGEALKPIQIPGLTDVVSMTTDSAVKADGTVWQWSIGDKNKINVTQTSGIQNAVSITSGNRNHYVLLKDGHVLAWGTNEFGQTGLGVRDFMIDTPKPVKKWIQVQLNNNEMELTMAPLLINNSTYVPLRGVFQQMGVNVRWDVPSRSVVAVKGSTTLILNSVNGQTTVDGKGIATDQKPVFINDSVYVPLRLISEMLGAKVEWDAEAYAVRIHSN